MSRKIVITLESDGKLGVEGNLQDELIVYGMMKKAEQVLQAHYLKTAEGSRIVKPMLAGIPQGRG